jgi:hypothetical protein
VQHVNNAADNPAVVYPMGATPTVGQQWLNPGKIRLA